MLVAGNCATCLCCSRFSSTLSNVFIFNTHTFYDVWCLKLLKQTDAFWISNKQKYKYEERCCNTLWVLGDIFNWKRQAVFPKQIRLLCPAQPQIFYLYVLALLKRAKSVLCNGQYTFPGSLSSDFVLCNLFVCRFESHLWKAANWSSVWECSDWNSSSCEFGWVGFFLL